ncbi:Hypothetical protein DPCES_3267 [Desulfitobacterium hafniense]|uniref:Uncharacterized protein n=1 Tax=Desulfitobacterium hafniense TaxID=49338 RepID=A0A098B2P5_DESHA|nr:Hypothetical protein DPCES_3267 [Desulfitobacterium hafniense]
MSSCTSSAAGKVGLLSIKTSDKPIKNRLLTNDFFENMDEALGLDLLFIEEGGDQLKAQMVHAKEMFRAPGKENPTRI